MTRSWIVCGAASSHIIHSKLKDCYLIKHNYIIIQEIHYLNRVSILFLCFICCISGCNTGNTKEGKVYIHIVFMGVS